MSLKEKERRLNHVKKGKDLRRYCKDRDDAREAKKEMFKYKTR